MSATCTIGDSGAVRYRWVTVSSVSGSGPVMPTIIYTSICPTFYEGQLCSSEGFLAIQIHYCCTQTLTAFPFQSDTLPYCNSLVGFQFQWNSTFTVIFVRVINIGLAQRRWNALPLVYGSTKPRVQHRLSQLRLVLPFASRISHNEKPPDYKKWANWLRVQTHFIKSIFCRAPIRRRRSMGAWD